MADLDFKNRNEFRKGARLRTINEDPTYLSFVLLFHYHDHHDVGHSPLLDGTAEKYLRSVVRDDVGNAYADNLKNFVRVLRKVNLEMPWFWNGLKGLETALAHKGMLEPWRGAEENTLEITCLDENVELTAIGLMDLYKRSCFDFERYVEVVPRNLREFSLDVIVSEVRVFQKDTDARNLGINDTPDSQLNASNSGGGSVAPLHEGLISKDFTSADATPFIRLRFTHCEFDIDSIADYFADMSKNPERKQPSIKIHWGTCRQIDQKLGDNLFKEQSNKEKSAVERAVEDQNNPADPANNDAKKSGGLGNKYIDAIRGKTLGKVESTLEGIKEGVERNVADIKNSFQNPDQPGIINTALTGQLNKVTQSLLIGNVHGIDNIANDINSALAQGSLNGIANLFGGDSPLGNLGDNPIDSSPDGLNLGRAHDNIAPDSDFLGKENIHPTAVDSSPDGSLKENVHE